MESLRHLPWQIPAIRICLPFLCFPLLATPIPLVDPSFEDGNPGSTLSSSSPGVDGGWWMNPAIFSGGSGGMIYVTDSGAADGFQTMLVGYANQLRSIEQTVSTTFSATSDNTLTVFGRAIGAGKHIWSEKPIANSLAAGQELLALSRDQGLRLWGAPTVVQSPQFAFMAKTLAAGTLDKVAAAHASYGHLGPGWAQFFYSKGGGSLPDLGVYNLTFLTGLLGPARAVTAMTSIVTPQRTIQGTGEMEVVAEDNAMVLLDHGDGVISHIECGFNYFNPKDHAYTGQDHHTLGVTGRGGVMKLAGYDWGPHGVDLATAGEPGFKRHAADKGGYTWEGGAALCAECLATGNEPLFTPEHALHVVEIITGARLSQETGRHIPLKSTFKWPVVS